MIYASGAKGEKRNKFERQAKLYLVPESVLGTVDHDLHKSRRAALNRFFSTASVRRLQFVIDERVQVLLERFRGFKNVEGKEGVIKADYAFAAFTNGELHMLTRYTGCLLTWHQTLSRNMRMAGATLVSRLLNSDLTSLMPSLLGL